MRTRRNPGSKAEVPVLGFDLSLSAPAACFAPAGWRPGDWGALRLWTRAFATVPDDDIAGQIERLVVVARAVHEQVVEHGMGEPALVVAIEGYAFRKRSASVTKLAELGGVVRVRLLERWGVVPVVVPAAEARKYLLGKVPRSEQKVAVQAALWRAGAPLSDKLVRRHGVRGVEGGWTEDQCDAFCVMNGTRARLGLPFLTLAASSRA